MEKAKTLESLNVSCIYMVAKNMTKLTEVLLLLEMIALPLHFVTHVKVRNTITLDNNFMILTFYSEVTTSRYS